MTDNLLSNRSGFTSNINRSILATFDLLHKLHAVVTNNSLVVIGQILLDKRATESPLLLRVFKIQVG